jgi:hypothetical protein
MSNPRKMETTMKSRKDIIRAAQRIYAEPSDDEVEISDNASVTQSSDGGFWVAAHVYVRSEDIGRGKTQVSVAPTEPRR